jgi:hypothetical protein
MLLLSSLLHFVNRKLSPVTMTFSLQVVTAFIFALASSAGAAHTASERVDFPRRLDLEQCLFADTIVVIELDIGKTNCFQVTWRRGRPIRLRYVRSQRNSLLGR